MSEIRFSYDLLYVKARIYCAFKENRHPLGYKGYFSSI
jgi:hypothetical protein